MSEDTGIDAQMDDLTAKAHAAQDKGQRLEAQRLFDQRNRLAEGEAEEGAEANSSPGSNLDEAEQGEIDVPPPAVPEPLDKDVVGTLMGQLREAGLDEEVDELEQEWGRDVSANLAYAQNFMARFGKANPVFGAAVDHEVERDAGLYPAILRIAASLGRELVHGDRGPEKGQERMTESKEAAAEADLDRLTAEAHAALDRGESFKADQIFRKREALEERLFGSEPIVGQGGRSL